MNKLQELREEYGLQQQEFVVVIAHQYHSFFLEPIV